jgi:hypothetical protein
LKANSKIHGSISAAMRYSEQEGVDPVTEKRRILAEGEASRATLLGGQNLGFEIDSHERYEEARLEMESNALPQNQSSKTRLCEKDCLHSTLSWERGQDPSREEMVEAARSYLKALGMENAQAAFVAHSDTPHRHVHIIASRIDPETGKTYSDTDIRIKDQAWSLKWERDHNQRSQNESRQKFHKMLDAIEQRDGAALLEALTDRTPTFTARQLDNVLGYAGLDRKERAAYRAEILADKNVIALREQTDGPVTRYTTREVLASEMALQRNASILADHDYHGLSKERIEATAAAHTLKPEQAEALAHLTGAKGFAILWGEAGTGKSHTLNAVRAAYEAESVNLMGLSHTNKVVQAMRGDGFTHAETIASELKRIENGRGTWDRNTVLIVDEAAMVSTDNLAKLAAAARQSGAKLILAGDDRQLGAIERGGMFETLRLSHGAAILKEVQRVKDQEQQRVFGEMHDGEFLGALQLADKAARLHWADKQADTVRAMVEQYTGDVKTAPEKHRFMFAFSNAEVDTLNDFARAIHQKRGDLARITSLPRRLAQRRLRPATGFCSAAAAGRRLRGARDWSMVMLALSPRLTWTALSLASPCSSTRGKARNRKASRSPWATTPSRASSTSSSLAMVEPFIKAKVQRSTRPTFAIRRSGKTAPPMSHSPGTATMLKSSPAARPCAAWRKSAQARPRPPPKTLRLWRAG